MTRRKFLRLASGAGLIGCGLGCHGARRPPPSIVCVLVDQLRWDTFRQSAIGTARLAANGVVFERMRSVAPWTYPSVISMMSGLLPQQHGAGGFGKSETLTNFSLELPLVHRLLKADGWTTAAFVTNPFLREWNPFYVGFDHFDADFVKNPGNVRPPFEEFGIPSRMFASSVNEAVRAHFDATPLGGPELTYVHYIDAHGPWEGAPFAPDYESAVHFVDARILELYQLFRRRYDDDLLFIVTSDHGRALGDDTLVGDGPAWREMKQSVHDFNVRIPFVVLPGARVPEGHRVDAPCSNVDFTPTVLDIAGVPSSIPLAGRSLAPLLAGGKPGAADRDRAVYLRVSAFGSCSDAVVVRDRKYMRFLDCFNGEVTRRRIYDLERDPRETESLGEDFGEMEPVLLEAAGTRGVRFETTREPLSGDLESRLRALGYVD